MVGIKILRNGELLEIENKNSYSTIIEICEQHKEQNRALAFAFIIHDYNSPHLSKILEDKIYWSSLDKISGNLLTIFCLPYQSSVFDEDLLYADRTEKRGLYGLSVENGQEHIIPLIKAYLQYDEPISLPTLLFFQIDDGYIQDSFFIKLNENKIEEAFIELKDYIDSAIRELKKVNTIYYSNSKEIFNLLKNGVNTLNTEKRIKDFIGRIPVQIFFSWLFGKV